MAAPIISISSDSSKESVSSHAPRVILFGAIPAIIPVIPEVPIVPADPIVTPEVGTVSVISPSGVLDLVDYSSSPDSDPSEGSLPPIPDWPMVSPFFCSDDSEADNSSSSISPLDQSISEHTPPDTTDVDTSTPPRFVHQSLARTPDVVRLLDVGGLAPFSTPYLPTTSESSLGSSSERSLDSSSHSSRPSRKRCRSPTVLVLSHTHISRSITPTPVGLLPPRKRFRDSYSPEDSGDEHMEVDTADAKAVTDVEAHAADTREIAIDPLAIGDSSESSRGGIPDLEDT
ncbi:hypothetical protein Tco_0807092 [Tanacetum coccineum]